MLKSFVDSEERPHLRTVAVCGERIKQFRKLLGWTQDEFARRSGYSDRLIRKAESGHTLSYETIENLAQTLDCHSLRVSPDDLISSPNKNAQHLLDLIGTDSNEVSLLEIATPDCQLEFCGDAHHPVTRTWKGIDGIQRCISLFRESLVDSKVQDDAIVVVNDQYGFIHIIVSDIEQNSTPSEPINIVMRLRFQQSKISHVWVLVDRLQLEKLFRHWDIRNVPTNPQMA